MDIDNMSYDELVDLNHRVVARLKMLNQIRTHSQMMQFSIGEHICFQPPGREQLRGTVVKYNKKTVTIVTEQGEHWNVAPSFLTKTEGRVRKALNQGKIIDMDEGQFAEG